jgi:hypothetical protein
MQSDSMAGVAMCEKTDQSLHVSSDTGVKFQFRQSTPAEETVGGVPSAASPVRDRQSDILDPVEAVWGR